MSVKTYFRQHCHVCGRPLRIAVELLGRDVVCEHCHGRFVATDPSTLANCDASSLDHQVLLVEPNRDQLSMLTRRFTELGYLVTPVHHPRQAIEAATFKDFRVAVIDNELPETRGLELIARLHRRICDLQVILLVDPTDDLLSKPISHHGVWMILEKPCPVKRLESIIEDALHESRQSRSKRLSTVEEHSFAVLPK